MRYLSPYCLLLLSGCPPEVGDPCDNDFECASENLCAEGRCAERGAELIRRARGPEKWGASEALPETTKAEVAASGGVVVRTADGKYEAFVSCAADEQLVGGGCRDVTGRSRETDRNQSSFPNSYAPQHTLAARWECRGYSNMVRAFALCLRVHVPE